MRSTALLMVLCLLAGCGGTARGPGERFMSDQEIDGKDDLTCQGFGAARGTPAYVDCRLRLKQNRSSEDSTRRLGGAIIMSQ